MTKLLTTFGEKISCPAQLGDICLTCQQLYPPKVDSKTPNNATFPIYTYIVLNRFEPVPDRFDWRFVFRAVAVPVLVFQ
jgi:hypothetical protein